MKLIKSFLPVFPGFYGTMFEASEDNHIDDGKTYADYVWDYSGYGLTVCKSCVNAIEDKLIELGFNLAIKFEGIASPKEYNFYNDSINVTFQFKTGCIKALKKYLIANQISFSAYLKDTYTSCSGFISWYSNQYTTWMHNVNLESLETNTHLCRCDI